MNNKKNKSQTLAIFLAAFILQNSFGLAQNQIETSEVLDLNLNQLGPLEIQDETFAEKILNEWPENFQSDIKNLVSLWLNQGLLVTPFSQFGIVIKGTSLEIKDASELELSASEKQIIQFFIQINNKGILKKFVSSLMTLLEKSPTHGETAKKATPEQKQLVLAMLDQTLKSTESLMKFHSQNWTDLSTQIEQKLNQFESKKESQTRLTDARFITELVNITNAKLSTTTQSQILINGPASFSLRNQIMRSAKESINMITWAVQDDATGFELAEILIEKAKTIPVRLIVDGQVGTRPGYHKAVDQMKAAGVQVIRWLNPRAPFIGQHRKILIVDESKVITGGMNPGDHYSHKTGTPKDHWRDTDVYFEGEATEETQMLFNHIWNKQISLQDLKYDKITTRKNVSYSKNTGKVIVVEHEPKSTHDQHEIMLMLMKSIRGATKSIDIENAYIVAFPSFLKEIKAAIDRGVKVRVLTNSTESVDEPIVALPILRTAKKLADLGAEVYLKKGSTLHSKFMIIDQQIFLIGSYNIHPRSERMEGETVFAFLNKNLSQSATTAFENDISVENATRLNKTDTVKIPINATTLLPLRMFYDQL